MSSLRASSMALSASTARLGLGLLAALLDDAGEEVGDRAELGDVARAEVARLLGLDVEDADDLVVPRSAARDSIEATNRRWSMPRTHRKRVSAGTSGMTSGSRRRRDAAGHALAERHPRPADLEAVEAVRGRERQVRSIAIEQVQGGDVARGARRGSRRRRSRAARPTSGRSSRGAATSWRKRSWSSWSWRRRPGHGAGRSGGAVTGTVGRAGVIGHHDTSVGKVTASKGCGAGTAANGCGPRRSGQRERARATRPRRARSAPSRRGSGPPARATRSRARSGCSGRSSARSSPSRPGPTCSTSSSASAARRSRLRREDDPAERRAPRRGPRRPRPARPRP